MTVHKQWAWSRQASELAEPPTFRLYMKRSHSVSGKIVILYIPAVGKTIPTNENVYLALWFLYHEKFVI